MFLGNPVATNASAKDEKVTFFRRCYYEQLNLPTHNSLFHDNGIKFELQHIFFYCEVEVVC